MSSEKCAPKSKSGEIAHVGKAREPEGHVDPALIAARDLALAKQRQRLPDREFAAAGLVDPEVILAERDEPLGRSD
ncbi:hypothetical protein AB4Z40_34865 [Bosea sp. 2YAB26]|uniref:hypothetical protein n=1 Tax=Bosea sp. 2YAB26 TaxID=3237478 RepID=UPI003F900ABD